MLVDLNEALEGSSRPPSLFFFLHCNPFPNKPWFYVSAVELS